MSVYDSLHSSRQGYLVPIGGAEDKTQERHILSRVVQLSGGSSAHLAIIPTASAMPEELGARYCEIFIDLGAASARIVHVKERKQANDADFVSLLDGITGIFLTGGEQLRLVSALGGTKLAQRLYDCLIGGATVAGTSAGASAISEHMIAFGRSGGAPSQRMVQLAPGLGLTERIIIDQHFRQRDRIGRLMTAVAFNPAVIGVGIDEDTALVIAPDNRCEVIGSGSVTIVDGSQLEYTDIHSVQRHDPVATLGMTVHILTHGYRYDLETRQPSRPMTSPPPPLSANRGEPIRP